MSERTAPRLLLAGVVWLLILGGVGAGYRYGLSPYLARQAEVKRLRAEYGQWYQKAQERQISADKIPDTSDPAKLAEMVEDLKLRLTSTPPTGNDGKPLAPARITIALDSFSGYALFRSDIFKRHLAAQNLSIDLVDDGADYAKRFRSLATGQTPVAVFTIDALIKAAADTGSLPATIVLVIDESVGADAMVAFDKAFPNLDALNKPGTRIVAMRDSPSETLARVVMGSFDLQKLDADPFVPAKSAEAVYQQLLRAPPEAPNVYILWEPLVSKALKIPGTHTLIDSSRFRGYIVDVLVVQRDYLGEHEDRIRALAEAYLRASYEASHRSQEGLADLVRADAAAQGDALNIEQAAHLAKGIWWKNTTENYADLGVAQTSGAEITSEPPIARMIRNISRVLLTTGAIQRDPLDNDPSKLYYDRITRSLSDANFHPALGGPSGESTTAPAALPALTDEQWTALVPVGTLQVERIVFARGTGDLTEQSRGALTGLADTLRSFPNYYILVKGWARSDGDPEANKALAERRAAAAADFLLKSGIPAARIKAQTMPPSGAGGESQSVTFMLGQPPY